MPRIVASLSLLAIVTMAAPAVAQVPKAERSVYGNWVLKSVTIDGKKVPAGSKALSPLLKNCGGVQIGMIYKIRRTNVISMNEKETHFDYLPETKEMDIEFADEKGQDSGVMMDVKFVEKNMKLAFKDRMKKVEMVFSPED